MRFFKKSVLQTIYKNVILFQPQEVIAECLLYFPKAADELILGILCYASVDLLLARDLCPRPWRWFEACEPIHVANHGLNIPSACFDISPFLALRNT